MNVWLIEIAGHGPTFLAEAGDLPESLASDGGPSWLAARGRSIRAEIDRADGPVGRTVGRVWRRLQRLVSPDEHLLRKLRRASRITIEHPAGMTEADAAATWSGFLRRGLVRHRTWFLVDLLLAVPSFALFIVPGPNVVGYWIAYRTVTHGLALLGIGRARRGAASVAYRARADLDGAIQPGDHGRIARLAETLPLPDLALLLARIDPDRFSE